MGPNFCSSDEPICFHSLFNGASLSYSLSSSQLTIMILLLPVLSLIEAIVLMETVLVVGPNIDCTQELWQCCGPWYISNMVIGHNVKLNKTAFMSTNSTLLYPGKAHDKNVSKLTNHGRRSAMSNCRQSKSLHWWFELSNLLMAICWLPHKSSCG